MGDRKLSLHFSPLFKSHAKLLGEAERLPWQIKQPSVTAQQAKR
jgi:hypothetical protein